MFQEKLAACLWKLEALIPVAVLTDDFYEFSQIISRNYFSMASDLINEATKTNQASLNELLQYEL